MDTREPGIYHQDYINLYPVMEKLLDEIGIPHCVASGDSCYRYCCSLLRDIPVRAGELQALAGAYHDGWCDRDKWGGRIDMLILAHAAI